MYADLLALIQAHEQSQCRQHSSKNAQFCRMTDGAGILSAPSVFVTDLPYKNHPWNPNGEMPLYAKFSKLEMPPVVSASLVVGEWPQPDRLQCCAAAQPSCRRTRFESEFRCVSSKVLRQTVDIINTTELPADHPVRIANRSNVDVCTA